MEKPDANPSLLPNPSEKEQNESERQPRISQTDQKEGCSNSMHPEQNLPPRTCEQEPKMQADKFPPQINPYSNHVPQGYPASLGYPSQPPHPSYVKAPPPQYPPTMPYPINYHAVGPPLPYTPPSYHANVNQIPYQAQQRPPFMLNNGTSAFMAPGHSVSNHGAPQSWTTGLFDCMEDPWNALVTFFFPCITFGQIAEIADNGRTPCVMGVVLYTITWSLIGFPCLISCFYRTKFRATFNLIEAPFPDCFVHALCDPCALCQEHRELRNRGLDPAIGWHGNMMRSRYQQQQMQAAMVPPANQTMMGR